MGGQQRRQWRRGHGGPRMQEPVHGRIPPASVAGAAAKGGIAAAELCGSGGPEAKCAAGAQAALPRLLQAELGQRWGGQHDTGCGEPATFAPSVTAADARAASPEPCLAGYGMSTGRPRGCQGAGSTADHGSDGGGRLCPRRGPARPRRSHGQTVEEQAGTCDGAPRFQGANSRCC